MSLFGSLLDNMAQNALGGSLLGDALPNTQAQPQGGLLGAPAPAAQPQQFQPSPQQQQQMRSQFLMHIGAALQQGQPIANGVQNYQQGMVAQMQAAKQAQMAQQQQRIMGTFSQEMQAAGTDPKAQQAVIAKYAPYVPPATLKDMVSMTRIETPKPVGIKQTIEGIDPKTGQPATFALMDDTTVRQLQGIAPEKHLAADGNGNIYNTRTGKVEIPNNSPESQAFQSLIQKNKGDVAAAYDELKGAGKQDKTPTFSPYALAIRANGGQTGVKEIDALSPPQAKQSLETGKERPAQVNVAGAGAGAVAGNPDFMNSLAQRVAGGDMSLEQLAQIFPSRGQAGSSQRSQVVQAALKLNPKLDLTANTANFKNLTNNQTVSSLKYIGNLEANLNTLQQMIPTLQNGDWQAFNKLKMKMGGEFSKTNVTNFNALHSVLVNEAARALSGSGAITNEARDMANSIIPQFGSADSMVGAMNTLRGELGNRKSTLAGKIDFSELRQPQSAVPQASQPPGVPQIGQTFNGGKVLRVTRIK